MTSVMYKCTAWSTSAKNSSATEPQAAPNTAVDAISHTRHLPRLSGAMPSGRRLKCRAVAQRATAMASTTTLQPTSSGLGADDHSTMVVSGTSTRWA